MSVGGTCGKCGAPWFYDVPGGAWGGICAPPIRASCACWNVPVTVTGGSAFVFNPPVSETVTSAPPATECGRCGGTGCEGTGQPSDEGGEAFDACPACGGTGAKGGGR